MKAFAFLTIISIFLISCHKIEINPDVEDPTSTRELIIDNDFDWQSQVNSFLTVNINSSTGRDGEPILMYDSEYKLVAKAIIENSKAIFKSQIPSQIMQVVIFLPSTRASLVVSNFGGNKSITFNADSQYKTKSLNDFASPDCNTDCGTTNSAANQNFNVNNGESICLTGSINGNLTMSGSCTLKICGTANINNLNLNGNGQKIIIITNFGIFNINNLGLGSNLEILNYSENFRVSGSASILGKLNNYGKITVAGLNVNNGGYFENYGDLIVNGDLNSSEIFLNYGSVNISGNFTLNTSECENYCKIVSNGNTSINFNFKNDGYLKSGGNMVINGSGKVEMAQGAMLSTKNLTLNGWIDGGASGGQIKVTNLSTINGSGKITGIIDFCDENGIEGNNGFIGSSVTNCQGYVPKSECNPEGYGFPNQVDSDNDGVVDALDDYPSNAAICIQNFSPYNGFKTIAFEDLWPSIGDFDFNDLMIKTRVEYKSNSQNELVGAKITIVLSALGAGIHNGIGLQFLDKSNNQITNIVASVDGGVLDAADMDCIKITNDVFNELSHYYTNTDPLKASIPDTLVLNILFNAGHELGDLTEDFYIFRSNDRGHEIHVLNRRPTGAVSAAKFGTFDDKTDVAAGIFYKSKSNLPWAIEIVDGTGDFMNPMEKVDIINAYSMFSGWATSSGNLNKNWFKSPTQSKVFYQSFAGN